MYFLLVFHTFLVNSKHGMQIILGLCVLYYFLYIFIKTKCAY